jgi:adenylate kinase family enzyme
MPGSRVLVTGLPGSGKTTVAMALAELHGLTHVSLDRLYYGPAYAIRPTFLTELHEALDTDGWCLDDFGAPESRDLVWTRADTVVWLDLPFGVAFVRAVRRTWRRLRTRAELLPGCRESWLGWLRPYHPVRMSLTGYGRHRRCVEERLADPRWQHLNVIRLRSADEVDEFLGRVPYKLAA